jgi:hypothetical protein
LRAGIPGARQQMKAGVKAFLLELCSANLIDDKFIGKRRALSIANAAAHSVQSNLLLRKRQGLS